MCVWVCVCVCVRMCVYVCVCVCVYLRISIYVHMHIYIYIHVYAYMYINTCMSIHIYAYTGTCKCVYVYTEGPPLCDIPLPHVWHDPYMSVTRQVVEQECGDGRTFKGVCTWYLKHLAPGNTVRGFLRRTRYVQSCCAHPCPRLFDICDMMVYQCDSTLLYMWHDSLAPGKTVCGFLRCTRYVKSWRAYPCLGLFSYAWHDFL